MSISSRNGRTGMARMPALGDGCCSGQAPSDFLGCCPRARAAPPPDRPPSMERGMPWFPDFVGAVELARRQARAAGQADPVATYLTALSNGDSRALENVWPG